MDISSLIVTASWKKPEGFDIGTVQGLGEAVSVLMTLDFFSMKTDKEARWVSQLAHESLLAANFKFCLLRQKHFVCPKW